MRIAYQGAGASERAVLPAEPDNRPGALAALLERLSTAVETRDREGLFEIFANALAWAAPPDSQEAGSA